MTREEAFAQGFRCGHIEGRAVSLDCSATCLAETVMGLSYDAAQAQPLESTAHEEQWAAGYRMGYLAAAFNEPLPVAFKG